MENLQESDTDLDLSPKKGRGQYERKPRGSYQKHKLEKTISVKYYPNERLKPINVYEGVPNYPIYLQVSVKGQTTHLPATIFDDIDTPQQNNLENLNEFFKDFLDVERNLIVNIINSLKPFERDDFIISEFAILYKMLNEPVSKIVKKIILDEIDELYEKYKGKKQILYRMRYDVSKNSPLSSHYYHLVYLNERESLLLNFDADIWNIEHFESIIPLRQLMRFNTNEYDKEEFENFPYTNKMTFLHYLRGTYQKIMMQEFGDDKMQSMINDIDLLFKTKINNYENILLNILPK